MEGPDLNRWMRQSWGQILVPVAGAVIIMVKGWNIKGRRSMKEKRGFLKSPSFFLVERERELSLSSLISPLQLFLEGRIMRHHKSVEYESGNGVFVVWCRSSLGGGGLLWIDHIFSKGLDVDMVSNPLIERALQTWEDVEGSLKNCRVLSTSHNISGQNVATYRYFSIYNAMLR